VEETEVDFRLIGEFSGSVLNLIVDEWRLVIEWRSMNQWICEWMKIWGSEEHAENGNVLSLSLSRQFGTHRKMRERTEQAMLVRCLQLNQYFLCP